MIKSLITFLILNFLALAVGGIFTNEGVPSEWYQSLDKAPWTPPGWMFGAAWTTIMVCFSFYMAKLWTSINDHRSLLILFGLQWILNAGWNPVFFYFHWVSVSLFVILSLTALVGLFLLRFRELLGPWSLLILPYFIWLLIASSLNAYILFYN